MTGSHTGYHPPPDTGAAGTGDRPTMQMAPDETRQYFEDQGLWARGPEPYQVQMQGDLVRLLPPGTETVLDAACGNGLVSRAVAAKVRVFGADGSRAALRHFDGPACQSRLEALPFGDRTFDLVMANDVLEHLAAESVGVVRDQLFRVAARHVLITVPFLEDVDAGYQVCAACGVVAHKNRHERRYDFDDLVALTPVGWRLALLALSGAEWDDAGPEVVALRRRLGSPPPAPPVCAACGATAGGDDTDAQALLTTGALLAGVDVQAGAFPRCRTEVIACFHRDDAGDPWASIARSDAQIARSIDPMLVDLRAAEQALFRRDFVPSCGPRGYYCVAAEAVVGADGLFLDAVDGVAEVKIGHFARATGAWSLAGEAEGPARVRIQFHTPAGYQFVENVDLEGPFEHRRELGPQPGPFGRLAAVRVLEGRVRVTRCRLEISALPQEFLDPGSVASGFVALPATSPPAAVATTWYGQLIPHPAALEAGIRARRSRLTDLTQTAALDDGFAARAALVDGVVARVATGTAQGLAEQQARLQRLESELHAAEQRATAAAADCAELTRRVEALGADLAASKAAVADLEIRLQRVLYAEYAVNALRGARQRIRRWLPKGARVGPARAREWDARTAVMLVPDDRIDRRVLLEARSLVDAGWRVRVVGAPAPTPGDRHDEEAFPELEIVRVDASRAVSIPADRLPPRVPPGERDWSDFYWLTNHYYLLATERPFQVVVAHDLPVLPAAAMAAFRHGAWLAYDAHELYPEQHHFGSERRERYRRAEAQLAPLTDLAITVNASIADEMAKRYRIPTPAVILNCPAVASTLPGAGGDELRGALGISRDQRILLFLGSLSLNRNLEALVAAMAQVRNTDIALVLVGPGAEKRTELEGIARHHGVLGTRVFFHPPVAQADVLRYTAAADAGVIPYPHVDLNSQLCTPNKLFDFLVVGLPILANDSPELRRFVSGQGVGMVWPFVDAASIAAGIDAFFAVDHAPYRERLAAIGHEFTWQHEGPKVVELYERLVASGSPRSAKDEA